VRTGDRSFSTTLFDLSAAKRAAGDAITNRYCGGDFFPDILGGKHCNATTDIWRCLPTSKDQTGIGLVLMPDLRQVLPRSRYCGEPRARCGTSGDGIASRIFSTEANPSPGL